MWYEGFSPWLLVYCNLLALPRQQLVAFVIHPNSKVALLFFMRMRCHPQILNGLRLNCEVLSVCSMKRT